MKKPNPAFYAYLPNLGPVPVLTKPKILYIPLYTKITGTTQFTTRAYSNHN